MNGRVVSTIEGREHQAGYIGVEVVRGTVEFRHIHVTSIGASSCLSTNEYRSVRPWGSHRGRIVGRS